MTLADLQPFTEALKAHRRRALLPTSLDTAGLRALDAGIRRQSFFSAQTVLADYLAALKADVESLVNPVTVQRPEAVTPENPEGNVTQGLDPATARVRAKELLDKLGYEPDPKERGTIKDLSSTARVDLVLQTNRDVARGTGHYLQSQDEAVLDAFPCQELSRVIESKTKRDWPNRWLRAARAVGDNDAVRVLVETGRMTARKDSPIWQHLGDAPDGLGNPFPPFAFNSGMDVRDVGYSESLRLGLVRKGEAVRPTLPDDLGQLLEAA